MLKKITPFFLFLVFSLGASACGKMTLPTVLPGRKTPAPSGTPLTKLITGTATLTPGLMEQSTTETIPPLNEPTPIGRLTDDLLRNKEYLLPYNKKMVKLVNGEYRAGEGEQALSAKISGIIAYGDLDGDERDDAAFILTETMGQSEAFISLVAVTTPINKPFMVYSFQLGERDLVNTIKIQDAHIVLDMVVHGPDDQKCCPSQPVTRTFTLSRGGLYLSHVASKTPDGKDRTIKIVSPAGGSPVDSSVDVKGEVTIAPFENNLVYRVYDELNIRLAEGSLQVKSPEPGAPGTFAGIIDLSSAAAGLKIRLEVLDLSAADGSILAMDSVDLVRK